MGEISKSGLRRGRGGNASPSLLYKADRVSGVGKSQGSEAGGQGKAVTNI